MEVFQKLHLGKFWGYKSSYQSAAIKVYFILRLLLLSKWTDLLLYFSGIYFTTPPKNRLRLGGHFILYSLFQAFSWEQFIRVRFQLANPIVKPKPAS